MLTAWMVPVLLLVGQLSAGCGLAGWPVTGGRGPGPEAGICERPRGSASQVVGGQVESGPDRANLPLTRIQPAYPPAPQTKPEPEPSAALRERLAAARQHLAAQRYQAAIAELDAALNLPDGLSYDVLLLLAHAKREVGRGGEARLAVERAILLRPTGREALLLLGRLHREQGRLEEAIACFRSATLAGSSDSDELSASLAWYELGSGLAEGGYWLAAVQALEHFDRAVWEACPELQRRPEVAGILKQHPYGGLQQRVELLGRLGRKEELGRTMQWALSTWPGDPYLERLYVRTLLEAGQAGAAFNFCRDRLTAEVRGTTSQSAQVEQPRLSLLTLAIEAAGQAGQLDQWVSELAEDVARGQGLELSRQLGQRLDAAGQYAQSIRLWRALAAARPTDPNLAWALAGALKESGDLAAALDSLIEFVRHSAQIPASSATGTTEMPPDRLATWMRSFEATDELLRLIGERTVRPDCDFAACTVLAATAAAAGQTELAERLFQTALEKRPDFVLARLAWAHLLLNRCRWEEALEQANQALATVPNLPAAHFLVGEAYAGLDRHEEAEQAYKAAMEGRPDEVSYVLALARHHRRLGNQLAAQRYFQQAWSMDRSLGRAVEELIDSYLESGKLEIARECLRQAEGADLSEDALRRMRTALRFAGAPMQAEHLAELARQFDEHPDDATTGLKLAAGLYLNDRADEALPILERVQIYAPDDERLAYLLARVHLRRLENEAAIRVLEQLVQRYPRRQNALRLLSEAYLADFQPQAAKAVMKRMLGLDMSRQQREELRNRLLAADLEFGQFDQAIRTVDQWIQDEPQADEWVRAKLRVLLAAGQKDAALELAALRLEPITRRTDETRQRLESVRQHLKEHPEDADAQAQAENLERELTGQLDELLERRSEYVWVALRTERYEAAEPRVRAWLTEQPGHRQMLEWLIEVLVAARRGEEALEVIGELVPRTISEVMRAYSWQARAAAAAGRVDQAVARLTGLLEEGFVRADADLRSQVRQEIVALLAEAGQYDDALAYCDRWLADLPSGDREGRIRLLRLKSYVLGAADRLDEQVPLLEELLAAEPQDAELNNNLGYTWADRGERLDRALAMIKLAVAAEPLNAAYLDSLGWVYYKRGEFGPAQLYLARAVRLQSGQDPVVYDHLGDAQYRLGDAQAARQAWQTAADLLEKEQRPDQPAREVRLLADVRRKLAALEGSEPPPIAPTADESAER